MGTSIEWTTSKKADIATVVPTKLEARDQSMLVKKLPRTEGGNCGRGCTGGGAMSMSEYTPRRLASGKVKADEIAATGARYVVTSCHNCVDGLGDLIKHYKLDCEVKQLVDLVADALVVEECAVSKKKKKGSNCGRWNGTSSN